MSGVRLVNRVLTDVLRDVVGVVGKIEDMIIQSRLQWYGHVMRGDINSQIREVTEVEITGKRKKGRPKNLWEECIKKDLEGHGLRKEDAYDQKKWREWIIAKIVVELKIESITIADRQMHVILSLGISLLLLSTFLKIVLILLL